ncbi:MAG: O-antigen ligase family protein [Candidatus Omnitrophota bacterium]
MKQASRYLYLSIFVTLFIWLSLFVGFVEVNHVNIALVITLIILVLLQRTEARKIFLDKEDLFLWCYILVLTVGLNFTENREIAFNRYINYAIPILIVYFLFKSQVSLTKYKITFAVTICVLAGIVSTIGILEFIFHKNILYEKFISNMWYKIYLPESRIMSTQLVPAVLGTYLIASIPFSYFLIYKSNSKTLKKLGILTAVLCVLALFFTFSRGSFLAFLVLTIIYFYKKSKKIIYGLFISIFLIVAVISFFKAPVMKRFSVRSLTSRSIYERKLSRVNTTLGMLKDYPFLGVGLDNYRITFDKYHHKKGFGHLVRIPDNMHLMVLGETGILGYLAFISFILYLLINSFRSQNELVFTISVAIVGILVNMLTYDLLYWTAPFYIFWMYCGILASSRTKGKNA